MAMFALGGYGKRNTDDPERQINEVAPPDQSGIMMVLAPTSMRLPVRESIANEMTFQPAPNWHDFSLHPSVAPSVLIAGTLEPVLNDARREEIARRFLSGILALVAIRFA